MSGLVIKSSRRRELYEPPAESVGRGDLIGDAPQGFSTADVPSDPALPDRLLRILVVHASINNRFIITACLKSTPYRVEEAEDGDVALKKFKLGSYDLVLLETHGPLVDGYTAVRELRNWEVKRGLPRAPLVALIPSTFGENKYQALSAGYDDYITTPVSKRTLLDAIQAWTSPVDPMALGELRALDTPGQESLLATLIDQFLRDLDSRLTAIREALSAGDGRNLQITAHTLRGSCGHFGAHRMARLCAYLERDSGEINANSFEVVTELEIEAMHVRFALAADLERVHRAASRL